MESLPNEIILEIIGYLNPSDLLQLRSVNLDLYSICTTFLQSRLTATICTPAQLMQFDIFKDSQYFPFRKFAFGTGLLSSQDSLEPLEGFCKSFGIFVSSLDLGVDDKGSCLLVVRGTRDNFLGSMSVLFRWTADHLEKLSVTTLCELGPLPSLDLFPKLVYAKVSGDFNNSYNVKPTETFLTQLSERIPAVTSLDMVVGSIKNIPKILRNISPSSSVSIRVSGLWSSDITTIDELTRIPSPRNMELSLTLQNRNEDATSFCQLVTIWLSTLAGSLRKLTISGQLGPQFQMELPVLPKLEELSLAGNGSIAFLEFHSAQFPNLKKVEANYYYLPPFSNGFISTTVKSFSAQPEPCMSDVQLYNWAHIFPNVTNLELTHQSFQLAFRFPKLVRLTLRACFYGGDYQWKDLTGGVDRMRKRNVFTVPVTTIQLDKMNLDDVEPLDHVYCLRDLKHLEHLAIEDCSICGVLALIYMSRTGGLKRLKTLEIQSEFFAVDSPYITELRKYHYHVGMHKAMTLEDEECDSDSDDDDML